MTAAISIIGGVISAFGAMQAANAQAQAAEYNAAVARRNAQAIRSQADEETKDQNLENSRRLAVIRTAYGAAGIDLAGSPLDVITDTAVEGELDIRRIQYAGELRAIDQQDQAKLYELEAKNDRQAGAISAVGKLFGGFSSAFSNAPAGSSLFAMA